MRFSPTKLLHGLLCTAPVLLLTLAACGGGGGGGTTGGGGTSTYSLGGAVTGQTSTVVLQNNGGDNKSVSVGTASYAFATRLAVGASYSITVLTQPSGQICTVANATGTMSSAGVSNAAVTCTDSFNLGGTTTGVTRSSSMVLRNIGTNGSDDLLVTNLNNTSFVFGTQVAVNASYSVSVLSQPSSASAHELCTVSNAAGTMVIGGVSNVTVNCASAYTIGGTAATAGGVTGLVGNLVLQNNLVDNLAVAGNGNMDFTFSTPLLNGDTYSVTVLKEPYGQDCSSTGSLNTSGSVGTSDVINVKFTCIAGTIPAVDRYAYSADFVSNSITAFDVDYAAPPIGDGHLINNATYSVNTGTLYNPSSIKVYTAKAGATSFVYVTNYSSGGTGYISAYQINSGVLAPLSPATIPTGKGPYAITIHPTGKYAYVVNKDGNSISAYNIDATTGALASIDADGATAAIQTSIATGLSPIAIAIHPGGGYAYVVNNGANTVSVYSIDVHTGALTLKSTPSTGTAPASITIDPTGRYAYVANSSAASVTAYNISSADGSLSQINCVGGAPSCSSANFSAGTTPKAVTIDPSGTYVYVANSGANSVSAYSISSGSLVQIDADSSTSGIQNFSAGVNPSSIRIDNSGTYLYVANYDTTSNITPFSISSADGKLTPIGAVNAGSNPNSFATAP